MKRKIWLLLALSALCVLMLCACGQCEHDWQSADCKNPKTCDLCGQTEGAPQGHEWYVATCEKAKTCAVCGEVDGQALGHSWQNAFCESPKTCATCNATEGQALGHVFAEYLDCENPPACGNCGILSQAATDHTWQEATCDAAKTCTTCGKVEGAPKGHEWYVATCETAKTCAVCGKTDGEALGHDWKEATCNAPKICQRCAVTEGDALGHSWIDATCTAPKACVNCGLTEGEPMDHDWQEATTEAPKTCTLCGATEGEKLSVDSRFNTAACQMLFGVWGHTYVDSYTSQSGETVYVECAEMMTFTEDGRCQVVEVFKLEQYKAYMQLALEDYLYDYYAKLGYSKDTLEQAMLAQYGLNVHDYVAQTVNGYTQEDAKKITDYVYYVADDMVCLGASWEDSFSGLYCTVEGDILTLKNTATTITLTRMNVED